MQRAKNSTLHPVMKTVVALTILMQLSPAYAVKQAPPAAKQVLTLDGFISQVEEQNEGFKRADKAVKGADLRSDEWKLVTSPYVFGKLEAAVDQRETAAPAFQGSETDSNTAVVGVGQRTRFGLDAKLSYTWNTTEIKGASPGLIAVPAFAVAGPAIELTQSVFKNGFGRETQANQEAVQAANQAQKFSESYTQTQLRIGAESAYWRLAVAREAVTATQESLDRSMRSRKWAADRTRYELADKADLLQADAASAAREMELQKAKDEQLAASRAFNTARGLEAMEVPETLSSISEDLIKSLAMPSRNELRADVKAAEAQSRAARAQSAAGVEGTRPTVDVYAKLGLNGRDPASSAAISESFGTSYPNYAIGVNLNVPLEMGIQSRVREGHRVQAQAQELLYRRKVYETEREWLDLERKFNEGKNRLTLALKLEQAQKAKLDTEKSRLTRGRTTTYNVIMFEEDFANAQLNRIRMAADVLGIYSQMKAFGGAQ